MQQQIPNTNLVSIANSNFYSKNKQIAQNMKQQYHLKDRIDSNRKIGRKCYNDLTGNNNLSRNSNLSRNINYTRQQDIVDSDRLLSSDQQILNKKLNFILNAKQKRLKSPTQPNNLDLTKLSTDKYQKVNPKVDNSNNNNNENDNVVCQNQNELKQKLRSYSPKYIQKTIKNKAIKDMMMNNIKANDIKINRSVNSRLKFRVHSPQNDVQRTNFKGPLIQKNMFPKVFGEVKNIEIQENASSVVETKTKKIEVINHHINLSSLKSESTKNTETKFELENVNCGYLKRNPKVDINQNTKKSSQQAFQQIMQNIKKMKTRSVQLSSQRYQLNQIVTIKKLTDQNYQQKKVLYLKYLELLVLSEIRLEKIVDIQKIRVFLQNWKQEVQIQSENAVQIKELYWNSPEDHISILHENLKHGSIKKMVAHVLGAINITGVKSIVRQILDFVNCNSTNIDMIVNHQLINADNIYLFESGKIKIGLNVSSFLRHSNRADSFRKNFVSLNYNMMTKSQQFRIKSIEEFKTNSSYYYKFMFDLGLLILELFFAQDIEFFQQIDSSLLERDFTSQNEEFCCLLHLFQDLHFQYDSQMSKQLSIFKKQLQKIFGNSFGYILMRFNKIDNDLLDFLCLCFNCRQNYQDIWTQIQNHSFIKDRIQNNYQFNQFHNNSQVNLAELYRICQNLLGSKTNKLLSVQINSQQSVLSDELQSKQSLD